MEKLIECHIYQTSVVKVDKDDMVSQLTSQVAERFKKSGFEVDTREISKRLELLITEFRVPESEAVRTVTNYLMKELDISREQLVGESPTVKIADIVKPNQWISLKAKVIQLWDATSPNVSQVGLIGDETGIIKFVIWAKSEKKEIEEDKNYLFRNVVTDSFAGRFQVNVNKNSEIVEIDEDVSLLPRELEVVGALVAIQQNSGLIQRCSQCNRPMTKNICPIHGKGEAYDDLRIKGIIDDGENFYEVILNKENIKLLTGTGLEEARKVAKENLDRNAVLSDLRNRLLGKYFRIVGTMGGRYLIVKEVELLKASLREKVNELLGGQS
jgi:replication factor A1